MINRSVLVGRLTKDLEIKYTQSGTAVANFLLAVNRQFKNENGDRDADFINCVIWRKAAENFAKFTHKGSLVGIDGRIQTRNYESQQGQRVYVTEVVVDNFSLLEPKSENNNQNHANSAPTPAPKDSYGSNNGNSNNNVADDPFTANAQPIDISDDDLPF